MMIELALILIILLCIATLFYLVLLIVTIRSINKQIEFIAENQTNKLLTIPSGKFVFKKLVKNINGLLKKHRQKEIQYLNFDNDLKATIANITHDLRTPLTVANGYVKLLEDADLDEQTQSEYLKHIDSNLTRLTEQLQTLFEYAKLHELDNNLTYERINVSQLLLETSLSFYDEFERHNIEIDLQIKQDIMLITDEQLIKRIIGNVLQNIIRHGQKEATISLRKKRGMVVMQTANTTTNADIEINKVFSRFYTDDLSRSNRNTGLGLSIVQEFVERLGGRVEAHIKEERFILTMMIPIV